jgi:hypothetical protein
MIGATQARELALGLAEATEQDHHGIPSFRVANRIFATLPDAKHLRIMAPEGEIRAAVADDPRAFAGFWWGRRLTCVVVRLELADPELVAELLDAAWRRKAPRRLQDP